MRKNPLAGSGGNRRRLSAEARREQIMGAALKLFSRQGFVRSTTRQIAREAGISEGTIYRYYKSKEEILFDFLKSQAVGTLESLIGSLEEEDDEKVVREFFANRFALVSQAPELQKVLLGEALFNPHLAGAFGRKLVIPVLEILERYLSQRIRRGDFRKVDPAVAARILVGHFLTFTVWRSLVGPGRRIPAEKLAAGLASLFLDGIRGRPRPEKVSFGGGR